MPKPWDCDIRDRWQTGHAVVLKTMLSGFDSHPFSRIYRGFLMRVWEPCPHMPCICGSFFDWCVNCPEGTISVVSWGRHSRNTTIVQIVVIGSSPIGAYVFGVCGDGGKDVGDGRALIGVCGIFYIGRKKSIGVYSK